MNRENWSVSARNNPGERRKNEPWEPWTQRMGERWAVLFPTFFLTHSHSLSSLCSLGEVNVKKKERKEQGREWREVKWVVSLTYSLLTVHHPLTFSNTSQRRWEWQWGERNKEEWTELEWDRWTGPVPVESGPFPCSISWFIELYLS